MRGFLLQRRDGVKEGADRLCADADAETVERRLAGSTPPQ